LPPYWDWRAWTSWPLPKGHEIAEKLGKSGDEADAYAREVVASDFEEAGDHDVFRKIRKDFDEGGVHQSDHQIRRTMEELLATAVRQIEAS
jgi:hypothetical protein